MKLEQNEYNNIIDSFGWKVDSGYDDLFDERNYPKQGLFEYTAFKRQNGYSIRFTNETLPSDSQV